MNTIKYFTISDILEKKFSGEWGDDYNHSGVFVLRTTNFTKEGKLNLNDVAKRNISLNIANSKRLKKGDIILEKSGGSDKQPVGRVAYFNIDTKEIYLCNNFTQVLRINHNLVNSKYIFYCLFSLHKRSATENLQNKTTGIRNLQLNRYLKLKIPIPPMITQHKIASILEKAESAKEKRKEANRLTDEFLKSVFLEMFGDPVRNPKGWKIDKVSECCSVESGGTPSTDKKEYWENGNIPWLGSTACKDNFIYKPTNFITEDGFKNSSAKLFKTKTTLIALVGATIGKTGFLTFDSTTNQNIVGMYPKNINFLLPEYLFFTSQYLYLKFLALSKNGFKMANLSFIRNLKIPIPSIDLQQKFADIVRKVEKLKEKQKKSEKELDNLFNCLMQKLILH